jgi:hypothetical protein
MDVTGFSTIVVNSYSGVSFSCADAAAHMSAKAVERMNLSFI